MSNYKKLADVIQRDMERGQEVYGTAHILNERAENYGSYEDNARISQALKKIVKSGASFNEMTDVQIDALGMICHKIARIVNGDPNYDDSWRDIAGYAELVVKSLEKSRNE